MTDFADSSVPYDDRARAVIYTVPEEAAAVRRIDKRTADASVLLGALSVVAFWSFGVGILLGVVAVAAGALALRIPDADRSDAVIGMLTGAVGIAVGAIFVATLT